MPSAFPPRILVTGASGFIGRALVAHLVEAGSEVVALYHARPPQAQARSEKGRVTWQAADIRSDPLEPLLAQADCIVHAAGIAHERAPASLHRAVTVEGTRRLVEAMQRGTCRRLVFVSSIRAQVGAFHEGIVEDAMPPAPQGVYGIAKGEAEEIIASSGLAATILRPVLVVDAGARGNLAALLRLARMPLPLPLGALRAKRSLITRSALVDAIVFALCSEETIGARLSVADAEPLALAEIVALLREAAGRAPMLVPVPAFLLAAGLRAVGREAAYDRLARPLVVAADGLRRLGWTAPETGRQALQRMARVVAGASDRLGNIRSTP